MAIWVVPEYSRGQVDVAGATLVQIYDGEQPMPSVQETNTAWEVINNWRSSHAYPLQAVKMTLLKRARNVDGRALVAQRIKRMFSIAVKLGRNPNMKLSQMQDLGGCRAVLKTARDVDELVKLYDEAHAREEVKFSFQREMRPQFSKKFDYLSCPKPDGYRGVHLVYKYYSGAEEKTPFHGLRIEIQLRSRLQHAWATAVETVDTYTKQALKVGGGNPQWRRFFTVAASAIALREKKPLVPGTPQDPEELVEELRGLVKSLDLYRTLDNWARATNYIRSAASSTGAITFVLILYVTEGHVEATGFGKHEQKQASEAYLQAEKSLEGRTDGSQAVLVTVRSIQALRSSFPNYFADTREFMNVIRQVAT